MRYLTRVPSRWLGVAAVSVVVAAGLAACGHRAHTGQVHFAVLPEPSLQSDPVRVTLDGLAKGASVTVEATARDADGKNWTSSARFSATTSGAVSLAQPFLGGSYTGVNAMGLFEFMVPAAGNTEKAFATSKTGFTAELTAVVNGRSVTSQAL